MPWDPDQYHRFRQQREQPFADLLALIHRHPGMRVIDLGCGTGELTLRLHEALPQSAVLGIDSSPAMLAKARALAREGLTFREQTIEHIGGEWDLVFSHAALHWVEDHRALIPRLVGMLALGGQLAIQMPDNITHPHHRLLREVAAAKPFAGALGNWEREWPVLPLREYAELLYAAGGREITAIAKVYPHELPDADAMVEWTKGTAMLPYLEGLPGELRGAFEEEYRRRLGALFPESPVFFGFQRILLAATRVG